MNVSDWEVQFNNKTLIYKGFDLPDLIDVLHQETTNNNYVIKITRIE